MKISRTYTLRNTKNIPTESGYSDIVSMVLSQRGMTTSDEREKFMHPRYDDLSDPRVLHDMDKAVERIRMALEKKEKITIYGDYGADGS